MEEDNKMTSPLCFPIRPAASDIHDQSSLAISSFASLLSSAVNDSNEGGISQPLKSDSERLPQLIRPSSSSDDRVCCTAPCLDLIQKKQPLFVPMSSRPALEDAAAWNMRQPIEVRRSDLVHLPPTLLLNLSTSFMSLVDSRLRSYLSELHKRSLNSSDQAEGGQHGKDNDALVRLMVKLLTSSSSSSASSSPIAPTSVVTTFRTLDSVEQTNEGEYVLPLVMEAVLDLNVLKNNLQVIKLQAPGTIQGSFACNDDTGAAELTKVDVMIDTTDLLKSMMEQARAAVRKAVRTASEVATLLTNNKSSIPHNVPQQQPSSSLAIPPEAAVQSLQNAERFQQYLLQRKMSNATTTRSENPNMPPPPARATSLPTESTVRKTSSCSGDDPPPTPTSTPPLASQQQQQTQQQQQAQQHPQNNMTTLAQLSRLALLASSLPPKEQQQHHHHHQNHHHQQTSEQAKKVSLEKDEETKGSQVKETTGNTELLPEKKAVQSSTSQVESVEQSSESGAVGL